MKLKSAIAWAAVAAVSVFLLTAEVVDRIVAVVGEEVITQRELDQFYADDSLGLMTPDPASGRAPASITKDEYLDKLIERMVIEQEVKRQGIRVDALDVEKAVDRKRESLGLTQDEFARALAMQGITMDQYREQVRTQLVTYRLISQEVRGEVEVSDERVRSYYNAHPEQFTGKDQYHLYHIFIPFAPEGVGESKETTEQDLNVIRSQIKNKDDFMEMAKLYSKTPTAPQGGDLGWFTLSELLPEFETRVKDLYPGEMTPVFESGGGVHLILLAEVKKGQLIPFDQVQDKIKDKLYQDETMERYDLWIERLRARTHIEKRL